MLGYILVTNGKMRVIPVDVDLKTFTHITIENRRLSRTLLLSRLTYCDIHGCNVPVFILPEAEFLNTDQPK